MFKRKLIDFSLSFLFIISIFIIFYGFYISYNKELIINDIEFVNLDGKPNEIVKVEEKKVEKKTTNKEYVIDENAIWLLIFENCRSINIYTTTKNFYLNRGSFKLDNNSILNEYGNSILLGHNPGNFSEINNLKVGDSLLVKTHKNNLKYKIIDKYVTDKEDPIPYKNSDETILTLITCHSNKNKRIVVLAKT